MQTPQGQRTEREVIRMSLQQIGDSLLNQKCIDFKDFANDYKTQGYLASNVDKYQKISSQVDYAVKHFPICSSNENQQQEIEGIKNEIKILLALQIYYPDNFVNVYGWTQNKEYFFMIMELASNTLYSGVVRFNYKTFESDQVACLMERCYENVAILHLNGIFHRDLKPPQFLLIDGNYKLADFGSYYSKVSQDVLISQKGGYNVEYYPPELQDLQLPSSVGDTSFIQVIERLLSKIRKQNNNQEDDHMIYEFFWQLYDSYALGKILMEIYFTKDEITQASQNYQQMILSRLEMIQKFSSLKLKKMFLITYLLLERNPLLRITINQIDNLLDYNDIDNEIFNKQIKIWSLIGKTLENKEQVSPEFLRSLNNSRTDNTLKIFRILKKLKVILGKLQPIPLPLVLNENNYVQSELGTPLPIIEQRSIEQQPIQPANNNQLELLKDPFYSYLQYFFWTENHWKLFSIQFLQMTIKEYEKFCCVVFPQQTPLETLNFIYQLGMIRQILIKRLKDSNPNKSSLEKEQVNDLNPQKTKLADLHKSQNFQSYENYQDYYERFRTNTLEYDNQFTLTVKAINQDNQSSHKDSYCFFYACFQMCRYLREILYVDHNFISIFDQKQSELNPQEIILKRVFIQDNFFNWVKKLEIISISSRLFELSFLLKNIFQNLFNILTLLLFISHSFLLQIH